MHRSPLVVIEPRAVETGPSPWAPGGSMDEVPPVRTRQGREPDPPRRPRRDRARAVTIAAAIAGAAALVIGALGAAPWSGPSGSEDATTSTGDPAQAPDPANPVAPELEVLPPFVPLSSTSIGDIEWTRLTGVDGSLPELISPGTASGAVDELSGSDRAGRRYVSTDGGRTWRTTGETGAARKIGGTTWRSGDRAIANLVQDGDDVAPPFDPELLAAPDGWRAWVEVEPAPGGFPLAAGDDAFVPATRNVQLPWARIGGEPEGSAHRVRVAVGERVVMSVSGVFHEMPITPYRVRATSGDRYEVLDADGTAVWTFEAATELDALRAVIGTSESVWLRWDGRHLSAASAPWPADHVVTVVELPGAVLARSAESSLLELSLWRSEDGFEWEPVELPAAPKGDNPAHLVSSGDGAMLTMLSAEGWTNWSTADGRTFDRVPTVTGIAERSQGSFGWVAADPRGLPILRVSADGTAWEVVDLAAVLDPRSATWNTSMTATAIGSRIYVAASNGAGRTLLIGTVAR